MHDCTVPRGLTLHPSLRACVPGLGFTSGCLGYTSNRLSGADISDTRVPPNLMAIITGHIFRYQ